MVRLPEAEAKLRAEEVIKGKTLWAAPTWDCNRLNSPCSICFASTVMRDARNRGYQFPFEDFFEKLKILSGLPFKEVVLNGGEPAKDPKLLAATLASIDPQRTVRIITNGDWILNKEIRERNFAIIGESGRTVRVEVSAHDSASVVDRKVKALREKVSVGIQYRFGEQSGVFDYRDIPREERHILVMGEAVKSRKDPHLRRKIELSKLMGYSGRDNAGMFLALSPEGAKVVANHETPYLLGRTPADIATGEVSAEEVLRRVVNYYAFSEYAPPVYKHGDITRYTVLDETAVSFAIAAFRTSVPIGLFNYAFGGRSMLHILNEVSGDLFQSREDFINNARDLMDGYYQIISGWSGESVEALKASVARAIAKRLFNSMSRNQVSMHADFDSYPSVFLVGESVPKDGVSLGRVVANGLFASSSIERQIRGFGISLGGFLSELGSSKRNFLTQISSLGVGMTELGYQLEELVSQGGVLASISC